MIEINKNYNESNLKTMEKMPDCFVDLTVTSPPYDNLRDYKGYSFPFEDIAKELYRVTKQGGVVVWVVGDATIKGSETGTSFKQALYFKEIGFNLHDTMIYIKNGGINSGSLNAYQQKFEYMFVLSKGRPKTINLIKDRPNKYVEDRIKRKKMKDGTYKEQHFKTEPFGTRYNYWIYDTGSGKSTKDKIAFNHPAIFPEKLAEDHIISWSNEGDIVFDPMCGAGTTCKMAWLNKRNFIGIDISEEYINDICKPRLKMYGWDENNLNNTINY
jgi:DNA modification methylase